MFESSAMPPRLKSTRFEPPLVALDAQLGAAGGDDRAGMLRREMRRLRPARWAEENPQLRLDQK